MVVGVLLFLAGILKMLHDLSEENKLPFGEWWNKTSWKNKYSVESLANYYRNGRNPELLEPKYWGSTNILSFTTDWFHLSSFLHTACYQLVFVIMLSYVTEFNFITYVIIFVLTKGIVGTIGEITRNIILK